MHRIGFKSYWRDRDLAALFVADLVKTEWVIQLYKAHPNAIVVGKSLACDYYADLDTPINGSDAIRCFVTVTTHPPFPDGRKIFYNILQIKWYTRRGLNPQPSAPEADALSN